MCQGSRHFSGFLHHFVLAKLATSSIRVTYVLTIYNNELLHFLSAWIHDQVWTNCKMLKSLSSRREVLPGHVVTRCEPTSLGRIAYTPPRHPPHNHQSDHYHINNTDQWPQHGTHTALNDPHQNASLPPESNSLIRSCFILRSRSVMGIMGGCREQSCIRVWWWLVGCGGLRVWDMCRSHVGTSDDVIGGLLSQRFAVMCSKNKPARADRVRDDGLCCNRLVTLR